MRSSNLISPSNHRTPLIPEQAPSIMAMAFLTGFTDGDYDDSFTPQRIQASGRPVTHYNRALAPARASPPRSSSEVRIARSIVLGWEQRLARMETLLNIIPVIPDDEDQEHMNTLHTMVTDLREDVHEASG
jgi:hypothetical protein